jgi:hypothetical protein
MFDVSLVGHLVADYGLVIFFTQRSTFSSSGSDPALMLQWVTLGAGVVVEGKQLWMDRDGRRDRIPDHFA